MVSEEVEKMMKHCEKRLGEIPEDDANAIENVATIMTQSSTPLVKMLSAIEDEKAWTLLFAGVVSSIIMTRAKNDIDKSIALLKVMNTTITEHLVHLDHIYNEVNNDKVKNPG
jgi:hypothetical protein